jgi:hypothetical protein
MTRAESGAVTAGFLLVASGPLEVCAEGENRGFSSSGLAVARGFDSVWVAFSDWRGLPGAAAPAFEDPQARAADSKAQSPRYPSPAV